MAADDFILALRKSNLFQEIGVAEQLAEKPDLYATVSGGLRMKYLCELMLTVMTVGASPLHVQNREVTPLSSDLREIRKT